MNDEILLRKINESLTEIVKLLEGCKSDEATSDGNAHTDKLDDVDKKIMRIFISVGIAANLKGCKYLREAVKLTVDKPDIIDSITSELYPKIAVKFETSKSKVERAMRHAIEAAWNRGKMENLNTLFGVRIYNSHEKPTNSEFIALIADKIMLDAI